MKVFFCPEYIKLVITIQSEKSARGNGSLIGWEGMINVSLTPGFNQVNMKGIESVTVSTVFINVHKPLKRLWLSFSLVSPR